MQMDFAHSGLLVASLFARLTVAVWPLNRPEAVLALLCLLSHIPLDFKYQQVALPSLGLDSTVGEATAIELLNVSNTRKFP